jgi:hypothetical protein
MKRARRSVHNSRKPRRNGNATKQAARKPSHDFNPAAALGILWVVAMPASDQVNAPVDVMLHAHEFAAVARDLVRIGILQKVRVRQGAHWQDAYKLAPLQEPLDHSHSDIVRQITDRMLEHPHDRIVAELSAVSGLLPKLLGGIYHPDQGSRLEYATQFLR